MLTISSDFENSRVIQPNPLVASFLYTLQHYFFFVHLCVYVYVCMCVCVRVCMCACACVCVCHMCHVSHRGHSEKGNVKWKVENRKWENGKKGTLHFTQQTANVFVHVTAIIKCDEKVHVHLCTKGQHIQGHCIMVHKLALWLLYNYVFNFWQHNYYLSMNQ